ncbi:hypothetical protein IFM89_014061 [Coptis chinensis]|uniref:non-specific serine/threonine protein kinase n=1 Tax=Coptis chinensis TaxID=261450 RepID=A0A835HM76_9MAGN|nr:hypothetical protein IFM89_014061 [Coptis chinensis]
MSTHQTVSQNMIFCIYLWFSGHGSDVDWWTFGIFLYKLIHGKTPFRGNGNRETLFNVVGRPLKFPDGSTFSFATKDLIRGLLPPDIPKPVDLNCVDQSVKCSVPQKFMRVAGMQWPFSSKLSSNTLELKLRASSLQAWPLSTEPTSFTMASLKKDEFNVVMKQGVSPRVVSIGVLQSSLIELQSPLSGFVISDWQGVDRIIDPPHANYLDSSLCEESIGRVKNPLALR